VVSLSDDGGRDGVVGELDWGDRQMPSPIVVEGRDFTGGECTLHLFAALCFLVNLQYRFKSMKYSALCQSTPQADTRI